MAVAVRAVCVSLSLLTRIASSNSYISTMNAITLGAFTLSMFGGRPSWQEDRPLYRDTHPFSAASVANHSAATSDQWQIGALQDRPHPLLDWIRRHRG